MKQHFYLNGGNMMKWIASISILGVFMTFGSLGAQNRLSTTFTEEKVDRTLKEDIAFGNMRSPLEVYVFTEWECPACRSIEPTILRSSKAIMQKAKLIFIDHVVHKESLNYIPYNLSFMINNKGKYFQLRQELFDFSIGNQPIKEEHIQEILGRLDEKYTPLEFSDLVGAEKYFEVIAKQLDVERVPTVVIVNTKTKKGKILTGAAEINEDAILKALNDLS